MFRIAAAGMLVAFAFVSVGADGKKNEAPARKETGAEKPSSDIAALEKDLKQAMASAQPGRAVGIIDQLAATGELAAFDCILQNALTGVDYDVDKHAGEVLLASQDPKVRAKIYEAAQFQNNPRYKTRIILLAVAAGLATDPAALGVLHNALKDPSKPVVLTALLWLRKLKRTESMEPLIDSLEAHEKRSSERVYHDLLKTLQAIAGIELEQAADWRNYWAARKGGTEPPKKKVSITVVAKKQTFFEVSLDTDRVLFVIDTSSSMTKRDPEGVPAAKQPTQPKRGDGEKVGTTVVAKKPEKAEPAAKTAPPTPPASRERMARVKSELTRVVNGLPAGTRFGILAFSHELRWWGGGKSLKDANSTNKADAVSWIRALVADGATRTDLALKEAFSLPEIDTMYLLTDGAPQDEANTRLEIDPILAYAKWANRFVRCRINTISFAQIRDSRMRTFVTSLASQNDGICTMLP